MAHWSDCCGPLAVPKLKNTYYLPVKNPVQPSCTVVVDPYDSLDYGQEAQAHRHTSVKHNHIPDEPDHDMIRTSVKGVINLVFTRTSPSSVPNV